MADDLQTLTQRVDALEAKPDVEAGWMSDVQRAIALMLIGTFAFIVISVTVRLVVTGAADTLEDMAKTLQAALVNMGLIALGFFFGSSMSKRLADAGQQKIVERLITTPPINGGGVSAAATAAAATVAAVEAAKAVAPAAAEAAAPAAAAEAAPPAAAEAAPPAVDAELDRRGFSDKPKELP